LNIFLEKGTDDEQHNHQWTKPTDSAISNRTSDAKKTEVTTSQGATKPSSGGDYDIDSSDDLEEEFNPYLFMSSLPSYASVRIHGKLCLPRKNPTASQLTLALDLDETLVHCTVDPIDKPDLVFPVTFNSVLYQVYVRKRPYLDYFLQTVSKLFEVRPLFSFLITFNII